MKKLGSLICMVLLFSFSHAQKQNNIWYFGKRAGINFNTSPPTALTDGMLSTNEGCATISDENGQLLFYTDGVTVYNKQHQVMANGTGLLGHFSSYQSAVVVPWPDNDSLYYIFTSDAKENSGVRGYNYSIVNIKKNGGLGEIILKNQLLTTPSTEKLTVAQHGNGTDWWLITKPLNTDEFLCYPITNNGIQLSQVTRSRISTIYGNAQISSGIKVSPDGKKLIAANHGDFSELFDFNNATGAISNGVKIKNASSVCFGAEFASNSRFLYLCSALITGSQVTASEIFQFDVSTYTDSTTLEATRVIIVSSGSPKRDLQLAPDGKIYVALIATPALGVISSPDEKGLQCNFIEQGIDLQGKYCHAGLPAIVSYFNKSFQTGIKYTIIDACKRIVQFSTVTNSTGNTFYKWYFPEGDSSSEQNPIRTFSSASNAFEVRLKTTLQTGNSFQIKENTRLITFNALPKANAGNDMAAIIGESFQLIGSGGIHYEWSPVQYVNNPAIANPLATLQIDQTFTLKVSNADGCTDKDQVQVKVYKEATIYVPTGFTPNGDGNNEALRSWPVGVKLESFNVYNRWGNLVFSTTDYTKGWNGFFKGKRQPEGSYVWIAKGTDLKGQPILKKGTTYLMK